MSYTKHYEEISECIPLSTSYHVVVCQAYPLQQKVPTTLSLSLLSFRHMSYLWQQKYNVAAAASDSCQPQSHLGHLNAAGENISSVKTLCIVSCFLNSVWTADKCVHWSHVGKPVH